jgi:hypothetical protein
MKHVLGLLVIALLASCATMKEGESWKMRPEDKTVGLTLLWNLPEAKIREMLPADQLPRIKNGMGTLMLFLCSTDTYYIGKRKYGHLGVAHLIIPLQKEISIPETIGSRSQAIMKGLAENGFAVRFGDVKLRLKEQGDMLSVAGDILLPNGQIRFSGKTENKKGKTVSLANTTLVGKDLNKDILQGPEFYDPIDFKTITVDQSGENWIQKFDLLGPPDRIWVNVDFGVDFRYSRNGITAN